MTAACEEDRGKRGGPFQRNFPQVVDCGHAGAARLSVCLWSTHAGGGSCGRSGWLLGSTQQEETQHVQHHQDQHQPDENLLHPQTRIQLLLQPGVAGHHAHELVRLGKKKLFVVCCL